MKKQFLLALTMLAFATTAGAQIPKSPSTPGAKVYFINLKNGQAVKGPVKVVMGLSGMGVAPAGTDAESTGHHHILVNVDKVDDSLPIPMDEKHRHFGKGQTEAVLDLPPGKYTLQLAFGDKNHVIHNPPVMSEKITIRVLKGAAAKK